MRADDDAAAVLLHLRDGGQQVSERFAHARAGFDRQVLSVRERRRNRDGHFELLGAQFVVGEASGDRSGRCQPGFHVHAGRSYPPRSCAANCAAMSSVAPADSSATIAPKAVTKMRPPTQLSRMVAMMCGRARTSMLMIMAPEVSGTVMECR
jgi:hypothetical protein